MKSNFSHKLPFYYLGGVAIFILAITVYKQSSQFASVINYDSSHAATPVTVSYTGKNALNQFGSEITEGDSSIWFGSDNSGYLGLHFTDVSLPSGATINSAYLEFTASSEQWISQGTNIYGEKTDNAQIFTSSSTPSSRSKTSNNVGYTDNTKWVKDQTYRLPAVTAIVSEVLSSGNKKNINFILQGTGGKYGRKFIYGTGSSKSPRLVIDYTAVEQTPTPTALKTSAPTPVTTATSRPKVTPTPTNKATVKPTLKPNSTSTSFMPEMHHQEGESMAMMAWATGGKNAPNPKYDKCDDGTDIVSVHNMYYVIAYDGIKYPTWHPPVVTNPVTNVGKCYFGHEHGTDPQIYQFWDEVAQHFGKDINGDGVITKMVISSTGKITPGDRAGLPFGIANEHMDEYYNQEGRDSYFVRHEDHVGHKVEVVNNEAEMVGKTTHTMNQLSGTTGINVPYYKSGSNTYSPTGVTCAHLHKFHQGTHSGDAIRNNLHEVVFHSSCQSVNVNNINAPAYYPNNSLILTGMMTFGNPGTYQRFCLDNPPRTSMAARVCVDGQNSNGTCKIEDPLISKLPGSVYSDTLGRNMVDRTCLENFDSLNPGVTYFSPYELWQGDLQIKTPGGKVVAEHGRQWDVLDPVRFVDPKSPTGFRYNAEECFKGGLLWSAKVNNYRTLNCGADGQVKPWDSPQSGFRGLTRTTYFGRNHITNSNGSQIYWTDPLGGNATPTAFTSGLKQKISTVDADIQRVQSRVQQLYGGDNFLNDRALQRRFNDGAGTVHAPN